MTARRFVGGPNCGLPAPPAAGTYVETDQGVYEERGEAYLFRGPHLRRCAGCGAYVERERGLPERCPLCGAAMG